MHKLFFSLLIHYIVNIVIYVLHNNCDISDKNINKNDDRYIRTNKAFDDELAHTIHELLKVKF